MRGILVAAVYALVVMLNTSAVRATDVTIEFGDTLQRHMARLDIHERNREKEFRVTRSLATHKSPARWYASSTASERLIPDLDDYSISALAQRIAEYNLEYIGEHETDQQLIITIDDYYASRASFNALKGRNTIMKGTVRLLDANGRELFAQKLTAYNKSHKRGGVLYYGDEHPYPGLWYNQRIGPMLVVFMEKAMSRVYPDADVPGPVAKAR